MQSLSTLLERLANAGITISADGDKLVVTGKPSALDADLRRELQERKTALLAWLNSPDTSSATPLRYPLNAEQTRIWFMDKLSQNDQGFVLQASLQLRGDVDTAQWKRAIDAAIQRHEILAARLHEDDHHAWLTLTEPAPGLELCDAQTPHLLPKGRLFRVLLQPHSDHYQLTFLLHHLIGDRTSMAILINDCFSAAQGVALPPVAQFTTQHLANPSDNGAKPEALSWWQSTLKEAPAELALPFDRARPTERGQRGAMISLPLPAEADLGGLAKPLAATPFMIYLAIYAQLLQRWSGEEDMVIGCPVSTRKTADDQTMVGFMVNTLPLRLQHGLNDDLSRRVSHVKQTLLEALSQPQVTLDEIVSALNPRRHLNRNPLFQVMFVLQAQPLALPSLPGVDVKALPIAPLAPEVDLNLNLERNADPRVPYTAHLEYDPDLFDERTAREFLRQFIELCVMAAQPTPAPAAQDKQRLACRIGPATLLPGQPVDHLIIEQLQQSRADKTQVQDAGKHLTTARLLEQTVLGVRALQGKGIHEGTRVGLCLPRLTELVPALLALWRCGACAVFLPTDGPRGALVERANRVNAAAVIVGTDSPDLAPASPADANGLSCPVLQWPALIREGEHHSTQANALAKTDLPLSQRPAYVCFTSGSTGTPKAVFISHASLLNHALAIRERFELTYDDTVLQFAAPAFDVLLEEIVPTLLAGASLVQLAPAQTRDLAAFDQALDDHGITVANLPAAFWHTWVRERAAAKIAPSLRLLVTGSEAVQASAARQWQEQAPHCRLLSAYGLTETTVTASLFPVENISGIWSTLPLGEPLTNTEVAIVGADDQPLPPLCLGEIRVRGQALMLSCDPETQPVMPGAPITALHTGDRGRMDLDGRLWCLGRRDRQVKIRGIRVEPAMLEHALCSLTGVNEAAALVLPIGQRQSLWAFVTGPGSADIARLKADLHTHLADVLIPEHLVALPHLPQTSQGKIDYKALAALAARHRPTESPIEPGTAEERVLAQIFSEILQRDTVGVDDNFFDLGGDSISSLQVISRARRAGLELTAKIIFEHQTVRAIAQHADTKPHASGHNEATGPLWATPILAWFKGEMKGHWQQFNQAVVIALPDPVDLPRLQRALNAVVRCHEIFGLHVTITSNHDVQYHIPSRWPDPAFDVLERPADLANADWADLKQSRLAKTQSQLNPMQGINVAAVAFPSDGQLMLTVHHLCIDVLSWHVVLRDLQTAYESQTTTGKVPVLQRHGLAWRQWSLALQAFSHDPDVKSALPFWMNSLSSQPDRLASGLPAEPGIEADARSLQKALPASLTRHVLRKVPAQWGLRMDETLLTALALVHASHHNKVLRVDLERNGRALPLDGLDISETVGWFTSVMPLSIETLTDAHTLGQRIKHQIANLPHEGLSYGLLRYGDDAAAARQLASLPDADVLLNYVGVLDGWTQGPFQPVDANTGPTIAPDLVRSHRIELNAGVVAGELRLAINYAAGPGSESAASALMEDLCKALERIAADTGYLQKGNTTGTAFEDDAAAHTQPPRIPVTPLQKGILLHSLHDPETYFDQLLFQLEGPLDIQAMQVAWAMLLERHAALRCSFGFDDTDEPCQILHHQAILPWHIHDWSSQDPQRIEPLRNALMQADRQKGFVMDQAPLMRMHLIQRGPQAYDWIWSSHHLVLDGWSVSILMQELLTAYQACLKHTQPGWSDAPDWCNFVNRWDSLNANTARQWWTLTLADASPTLMALDNGGEPVSSTQKTQQTASIAFSPELRDALTTTCRLHGVPLGVLLQASWAMLLRRYRNTESVVFGITFAHRPIEFGNAEALVGMTINTVPVVAHLQPQMLLGELLDQLKQQSFERADHAFIGLEDILQAAHHASDSPLFDTLLLVQNYPRPKHLDADGLTMRLLDVNEHTNFALTAIMTAGDDATLGLAWDPRRIPDTLGHDLLNHWHQLLQGMTRNAPTRVCELSIYTPHTLAQRMALAIGPDTGLAAPNVLERFSGWVNTLPDHPAIQAREGRFSYQALSNAVDHIAAQLLAQGLRPGEPVAILLPRGARAIAALLGAMKAGAMALPVDAAYPPERIAYMLADSQARRVVTESSLKDRIASQASVSLVLVDNMTIVAPDTSSAFPRLDIDSPAYLTYTSGSTGQPKGAITHHGGLANMMRLQQHHLAPAATDRVLQFAALSFDAAIWEIFMALGAGATLHIPDPDLVRFGEELLDTLEQERITIATLPPSLMVALPSRVLPSLRILMVAGEACPDAVVENWSAGRRFFNGYGPSEASVCATLHEVSNRKKRIPIGKPAAHIRAYVIDRDGQLVPPGGEGELLVGGAGVGLGYLHRPELTREKFRSDPWSPEAGHRVYHTGDRVQVGHDGELVFCGRIDRQLKVRGFRVEPGEIEQHLEQMAPISKALVGVSRKGSDDAVLLAWILPREGQTVDVHQLRESLAAQLPAHLVPGVIQTLQQIPLTPNGKVDWAALPMPDETNVKHADTRMTPATVHGHATDRITAIAQTLEPIWANLLKLPKVDWHRNFFDLGGQSLLLVKMQPLLRAAFNIKVPTRVLFEHTTINALAQWLAAQTATLEAPHAEPPVTPAALPPQATAVFADDQNAAQAKTDAIAIIGMACRFPGANSVEEFWTLLREGREGIRDFPAAPDAPGAAPGQAHFVARRGVIPDADKFDAAFFGMGPRDALLLDPQHRLFLESAWNAFEDAAEIPGGHVGVFAGCSHNTWLREVLIPSGEPVSGSAGFHAITANDKDFLATQVAYRLNLTGPAVTVQSACSTSLIAIAQAVDALRAGRCDMALAGGVSLTFPESQGYAYEPGMILSPDGHCKAFAADAAGTVPGAGVGVVLLKPLKKALQDGNRIYATIRGTGVSNDGARKMSFAAPGIDGQANAIQAALADADVANHEVDFIEAHGTGTALGDPVEITALGRAYDTPRQQPLLIGSVKSNIGHADAAAGVAGLIKATLSLHHAYLPASLHAQTLNPKLDPGPQRWFDIARQGHALQPQGRPLRAGVSSFGIGGTNAHIVLEQAPTVTPPSTLHNDWHVLPISATTPDQLNAAVAQLGQHLQGFTVTATDLATTLQFGRTALRARKAFVVGSSGSLPELLSTPLPEAEPTGSSRRTQKLALLLPGQGTQHPGMGLALLKQYPAFTADLAELSEILRPMLDFSLVDALRDPHQDSTFWQDTRIAQPAILALSLACARWWASLGIKPDMMLGHSLGEYTAACLAGVFTPEDALAIVSERARLMAAMPAGAMLTIAMEEPALRTVLAKYPALDLAAINGPRSGVISGPVDAIEQLATELSQQSIPSQRLRTSHAFHSRSMAPAADALATFLRARTLNRPARKFVSNLTGTWITPDQATSPDYWAQHMLAPVLFAQGLKTLQDKGAGLLIEAGPGQVLSGLARGQGLSPFPTLDSPAGSDDTSAPAHVTSVARLWENGVDVDWHAFNTHPGQRIALPGYPWARQTFRPSRTQVAADSVVTTTAYTPSEIVTNMPKTAAPPKPESGKPPQDNWFYTPRWRRQTLNLTASPPTSIVIFSERLALANPVAQALRESGLKVQIATSGEALMALPNETRAHVVVLAAGAEATSAQGVMNHIMTPLLALRDSLLSRHPAPVSIDLLTVGGATVQGYETVHPDNTALIAAFRVMACEFPEHHFAALDLPMPEPLAIARHLNSWLRSERTGCFLAWRQGQYWHEEVAASPMPAAQDWPLPEGATVLITGAAGGVGQAFALDIARHACHPHLLLATHRSPLPEGLQQRLEGMGASVSTLTLDLSQEHATTQALLHWQNSQGPITGVIHAAGLADYGGVMARRDAMSIATILAPKIAGLHGIEHALTGLPLDFVVLCSTLGSFLPVAKFGQAAYSAANAYLDSAACALSQRQPWRVIAVNWDDWVDVGMTVAARERAGLPRLGADHGLLPQEGPEALRRTLSTPLNRVAISVNDLPALMAHSSPDMFFNRTYENKVRLTNKEDMDAGPAPDSVTTPPETSDGPSAAPATAAKPPTGRTTVTDLADILQRLFGAILHVPSCSRQDNFFDLGGHSLLAMQLISQIKETTGHDLGLVDLFAAPTPDMLAHLLTQKSPNSP